MGAVVWEEDRKLCLGCLSKAWAAHATSMDPAVKWERTRELDIFIAQEKTCYNALWEIGEDRNVSQMSAVGHRHLGSSS